MINTMKGIAKDLGVYPFFRHEYKRICSLTMKQNIAYVLTHFALAGIGVWIYTLLG